MVKSALNHAMFCCKDQQFKSEVHQFNKPPMYNPVAHTELHCLSKMKTIKSHVCLQGRVWTAWGQNALCQVNILCNPSNILCKPYVPMFAPKNSMKKHCPPITRPITPPCLLPHQAQISSYPRIEGQDWARGLESGPQECMESSWASPVQSSTSHFKLWQANVHQAIKIFGYYWIGYSRAIKWLQATWKFSVFMP